MCGTAITALLRPKRLAGAVPEVRMDVSEVSAADVEVEYASAAGIRERAPRPCHARDERVAPGPDPSSAHPAAAVSRRVRVVLDPTGSGQPCPPGPAASPFTLAGVPSDQCPCPLHPQRSVPTASGPHDLRPPRRRPPLIPASHPGRSRSSLSSRQPLDRQRRLRSRAAARSDPNPGDPSSKQVG